MFDTDQLTALEIAIAQGVTSVKYQDKSVNYRNLNEMLQLRDLMRRDLGLKHESTQSIYARFNKGL